MFLVNQVEVTYIPYPRLGFGVFTFCFKESGAAFTFVIFIGASMYVIVYSNNLADSELFRCIPKKGLMAIPSPSLYN